MLTTFGAEPAGAMEPVESSPLAHETESFSLGLKDGGTTEAAEVDSSDLRDPDFSSTYKAPDADLRDPFK